MREDEPVIDRYSYGSSGEIRDLLAGHHQEAPMPDLPGGQVAQLTRAASAASAATDTQQEKGELVIP